MEGYECSGHGIGHETKFKIGSNWIYCPQKGDETAHASIQIQFTQYQKQCNNCGEAETQVDISKYFEGKTGERGCHRTQGNLNKAAAAGGKKFDIAGLQKMPHR